MTAPHDFTYDATNHKCECGVVETFTVTMYGNGVEIVSVNGKAVGEGETITVEYGEKMTIVLKNTVSSDNDIYVIYNDGLGWIRGIYDGSITTSSVGDNVTIYADALLNVKANLNGGSVSSDYLNSTFDSNGTMYKLKYDDAAMWHEKIAYCGATMPKLSDCFVREGYTLSGATGSDGKTYAADETITLTGDLTLDLVWACNHASTEAVDNKDGKTHKIVCQNEGCNNHVVTASESHTFKDHACEACGALETFSVSYTVEGKTYGEAVTVEYGTELTMPAGPAVEGYRFDGWKADEDTVYKAEETITVTSDLALEAVLSKYVTVTYYKYEIVEEIPELMLDVEIDDYFCVGDTGKLSYYYWDYANSLGWDTDGDGKVNYEYGAEYTYTGDVTLKPVLVPFHVKLDLGAEDAVYVDADGEAITHIYAQDIYHNFVDVTSHPTREGYRFLGWNVDHGYNGTEEVLVNEDGAVSLSFYGNCTATAIWAKLYTVTFTIDGQFYASEQYIEGDTIVAPTYTAPDGYEFSGWTVPETMPAEDITLDAALSGKTVNVNLIGNGGTYIDGKTYAGFTRSYNGTYAEIHNYTFTRTGYTFTGWNTAKDGSGTDMKADTTLPYTLINNFYAQWEAKAYMVTFDANDGVYDYGHDKYDGFASYDGNIDFPMTDPTREGYKFAGWNTKADGTGEDITEDTVYTTAGESTYYAKWECLHTANHKAVDNGDGTHSIVCTNEDCGATVTASVPHDFNNDAHKCACGVVDTFDYTIEYYQMGTDGEYTLTKTETKSAAYGQYVELFVLNEVGSPFYVDQGKSVLFAYNGAGDTVLKMYTARRQYTLTINATQYEGDDDTSTKSVEAPVYYGALLKDHIPENCGEKWDNAPIYQPGDTVEVDGKVYQGVFTVGTWQNYDDYSDIDIDTATMPASNLKITNSESYTGWYHEYYDSVEDTFSDTRIGTYYYLDNEILEDWQKIDGSWYYFAYNEAQSDYFRVENGLHEVPLNDDSGDDALHLFDADGKFMADYTGMYTDAAGSKLHVKNGVVVDECIYTARYDMGEETHTAYCYCGDSIEEDHDYTDRYDTDGDTHTAYCACGASIEEDHDYTDHYDTDGDTHTAYCVCGASIEEEHNFENDAHKCECGAVETYTITLDKYCKGVKIVSVNDKSVAEGEPIYVEHGKNLEVKLATTFDDSNSYSIYVNHYVVGKDDVDVLKYAPLTIPAANVTNDIVIFAYAIVDVTVNMNGGKVTDEGEEWYLDRKNGTADADPYDMTSVVYGKYFTVREAYFEKEGYTLAGFTVGEKSYKVDEVFELTGDVTLDLVWACAHTTNTKAVDNGDGTHDIVCKNEECNDYVVTENVSHTYDETTHLCACGVIETFTVSLKSCDDGDSKGVKIASVNGESVAEGETIYVEYGQDVTIVLKNTVSSDNDIYIDYYCNGSTYDWDPVVERNSLTIGSVAGKIVITVDALLNVKVNLNGGDRNANMPQFDFDGTMHKTYYHAGDTEQGAYYGGTIPALNTCFEKEGYTLSGATGSDGKTYAADETITLTGDLTLDLIWKCAHGTYQYADNGDGTHTRTCAQGCKEIEDHDFTQNEEHKCACGVVETFTLSLGKNIVREDYDVEIVSVNGEAVTAGETITVEYGKELEVELKNILSDTRNEVDLYSVRIAGKKTSGTSFADNVLTIPATLVTGDIQIWAYSYVRVTMDMAGGTINLSSDWYLDSTTGKAVLTDEYSKSKWSLDLKTHFVRDGYTLTDIVDADGTSYIAEKAVYMFKDMDLKLVWTCNHETCKYTVNDDGTHTKTCTKGCKEVIETKAHDFTQNEEHKCECGVIETFNYTIETYYMDVEGQYGKPVSTETKSAAYGEEISLKPEAPEGFSLDGENGDLHIVIGANAEGNVLKICFARNQYTYTVNTHIMGAYFGDYTDSDSTKTTETFTDFYGAEVDVTPELSEGYYLDETQKNVLTGTVPANNDLVLDVYIGRTAYNATWNFNHSIVDESIYIVPDTLPYTGEDNIFQTDIQMYPEAGYTITGIKANGQDIKWNKSDYYRIYIPVTGDMTIDVITTPVNYSITYNLDGGTNAETNPATYNIETDAITLSEPTKMGHSFTGWTWSGQTEPVKEVTIAKGSTGNKTYTANWEINKYTVTWTETGVTEELEYGAPLEYTGTLPTKAGYVVDGWTFYTMPGYVAYTGTTVPAATVYAYPNWVKNTTLYTVTFYNGDVQVGEALSLMYEDFITAPDLESLGITRDGYEFEDWVDADGESMPGKLLVEADQNYYIKWKCLHTSDTKAVDNEDGKTHKIVCSNEDCGETVTASEPHDFNNDAHTCACGTVQTFNYTIETYYMDVEGQYGKPVSTETKSAAYGEEISLDPEAPEGFSLDGENGDLHIVIGANAEGNVLKICFARNQYLLTINAMQYKGDEDTYMIGVEVPVYYGALLKDVIPENCGEEWDNAPIYQPDNTVEVDGKVYQGVFTIGTWQNYDDYSDIDIDTATMPASSLKITNSESYTGWYHDYYDWEADSWTDTRIGTCYYLDNEILEDWQKIDGSWYYFAYNEAQSDYFRVENGLHEVPLNDDSGDDALHLFDADGKFQSDYTGMYTDAAGSKLHVKKGIVVDEHDYTHDYEKRNGDQHRSYCICGEYILEDHTFDKTTHKCVCGMSEAFRITWDLNGGEFVDACWNVPDSVPFGSRITVNTMPTDESSFAVREGYRLTHFEDQNGAEYHVEVMKYGDGYEWFLDTMPAYDITLTAQWEATTSELIVSYVEPSEGAVWNTMSEQIDVGSRVLEQLPELENVPEAGTKIAWRDADHNGYITVGEGWQYYDAAANKWIDLDEAFTMPADGLEVMQNYTFTGWERTGDSWNYYVASELQSGLVRVIRFEHDSFDPYKLFADDFGWTELDENDCWTGKYINKTFENYTDGLWILENGTLTKAAEDYTLTSGQYLHYIVAGIDQGGLQKVGDDYYFFASNGNAATGKYNCWATRCDLPIGTYEFGADGRMLQGLVEKSNGIYYYVNGRPGKAGLTRIGEDYYFVSSIGRVATGKYYAWATNCDLPCGNYEFAEDGKMLRGIVMKDDGPWLYKNGKPDTSNPGITKIGDYYYFVSAIGRCAVGNYYCWATNCTIPVGNYNFDDQGRMTNPPMLDDSDNLLTGLVEKDNGIYYYVNGKYGSAGITKIGDYYYFVSAIGRVATGSYYCWATNCEIPCGTYKFDDQGRMLNPPVVEDGQLFTGLKEEENGIYYYVDGKYGPAGLTKIGEDYYFVSSIGRVATGQYYCWATNCDLPCGLYTFAEDGRMIR